MTRKTLLIGVIVLVAVSTASATSVAQFHPGDTIGEFDTVSSSGSVVDTSSRFIEGSYDGHDYRLYVPSGYDSSNPTPLLVMLHGCEQSPEEFAEATEMNQVAERENFLVLYPEQSRFSNWNKCWNWFNDGDQHRGYGEPQLINGMVNEVKSEYAVNGDRVYAAGMSAGGAMAVILGATYPDTFSAVASHSGVEYSAADSAYTSGWVLQYGGPDPEHQGVEAYEEMGSRSEIVPVAVFHGDDDLVVDDTNGHQTAHQWTQTNDLASDGSDDDNIDSSPEHVRTKSVPGGHDYTQYVYEDEDGDVIVEKYIVNDMDHAWSGGSGEYFTDPDGPPASEIIWNFFDDHSHP